MENICVGIINSGSSNRKFTTETPQQEHWQKGLQTSSLSLLWLWVISLFTCPEISQLLLASLHGTIKRASIKTSNIADIHFIIMTKVENNSMQWNGKYYFF